jgi:hypothetical protein
MSETPSDLLQWINNPERCDWPSEEERRAFERLLERRVGLAPDSMRYSPYMGLLLHIFCDEALRPFERAADGLFDICVCLSPKAPVVSWRIRRLGDKPWWESDRRWTFDRTSKVFEFARGHAQALCDEFGLQLLLPDPSMDEPLPGRFRKLDPKGPATIFTELFSEM